jgi:hypothetical protein
MDNQIGMLVIQEEAGEEDRYIRSLWKFLPRVLLLGHTAIASAPPATPPWPPQLHPLHPRLTPQHDADRSLHLPRAHCRPRPRARGLDTSRGAEQPVQLQGGAPAPKMWSRDGAHRRGARPSAVLAAPPSSRSCGGKKINGPPDVTPVLGRKMTTQASMMQNRLYAPNFCVFFLKKHQILSFRTPN